MSAALTGRQPKQLINVNGGTFFLFFVTELENYDVERKLPFRFSGSNVFSSVYMQTHTNLCVCRRGYREISIIFISFAGRQLPFLQLSSSSCVGHLISLKMRPLRVYEWKLSNKLFESVYVRYCVCVSVMHRKKLLRFKTFLELYIFLYFFSSTNSWVDLIKSVCPSVRPFVRLAIYSFVRLSVDRCPSLPVRSSVCLSVCLSVFLFVSSIFFIKFILNWFIFLFI